MSRSSALQVLQAAEDDLAGLRSRVGGLESTIASDPELDRLREAAAGDRSSAAAADRAATEAEQRAVGLRHHAQATERRLYDGSIGNPQELIALEKELGSLRRRLDDEEAVLLAAMERAEEAAAVAEASAVALTERERVRAESAGPNAARLNELRSELAEAERARDETAAGIDESALALYRRLAGRLRPVVVRLAGDSCGGCRQSLGVGEVRRVRAGDAIVQCPTCDRILVA